MGSPCFRRKIRGLDVPPEVLSAFVLERLKKDAQRRIGPFQKVVITVPAFFDETRRRGHPGRRPAGGPGSARHHQRAHGGRLGLRLPARLSQARQAAPAERQRVLVYDLGGGTFDVTILEIDGTRFHALATDGDVFLGGKDFDERLVNHLAEQFLDRPRRRSAQRSAGRRPTLARRPGRPSTPSPSGHKTTVDLLPRRDPHADRGRRSAVRGADPRPA